MLGGCQQHVAARRQQRLLPAGRRSGVHMQPSHSPGRLPRLHGRLQRPGGPVLDAAGGVHLLAHRAVLQHPGRPLLLVPAHPGGLRVPRLPRRRLHHRPVLCGPHLRGGRAAGQPGAGAPLRAGEPDGRGGGLAGVGRRSEIGHGHHGAPQVAVGLQKEAHRPDHLADQRLPGGRALRIPHVLQLVDPQAAAPWRRVPLPGGRARRRRRGGQGGGRGRGRRETSCCRGHPCSPPESRAPGDVHAGR